MYYPVIGILATAVLLIENHDILLEHNDDFEGSAWSIYKNFLLAVLFYYATDIAWGLFESLKWSGLLFANTTVYFFAMASGVYFWAQYIVAYIEDESKSGQHFILAGRAIAGLILICSIINIFVPIVFTVDEDSVYHATVVRDVMLISQIAFLIAISLYTSTSVPTSGKRHRYRTIMFFGLIMATFLTIQVWYPYLPLYSIAYMLGTCMLRTFVINDEREEHRQLKNSISELKKRLNI